MSAERFIKEFNHLEERRDEARNEFEHNVFTACMLDLIPDILKEMEQYEKVVEEAKVIANSRKLGGFTIAPLIEAVNKITFE